jgi:hypothetical protein
MGEANARAAHIDVLMKQYQMHASTIEKLITPLYNLAPVAIAACGVLLISNQSGQEAVALYRSTAAGVSACFALLVMLIWLGYVHSDTCMEGLRMVEIELKVSELLEVKDNSIEWYTRLTGEGTRVAKGLGRLLVISFAFGAALFAVGMYYGITGLLQLGVSLWACRIGVAAVLGLVVLLIINMLRVEFETRRAKAALIRRFKAGSKSADRSYPVSEED